jgi:hypothetical protein
VSRRRQRDDGAVALVTALVVMFVLLPVAAMGLTAYTRSGVRGEMQRAGDTGALAGAASLGLLDLAGLSVADPLSALVALPAASNPYARACAATATAITGDGRLSTAFSNIPSCSSGPGRTTLGSCVTGLTGDVDGLTHRLLGATTVGSGLLSLLPALVYNRVQTGLTFTARGPLDDLMGAGSDPARVTATARRVFQPLLPDAGLLLDDLVADVGLDGLASSTGLGATLAGLTGPEKIAVQQLQLLVGALAVVVGKAAASSLVPLIDTTTSSLQTVLQPATKALFVSLFPLQAALVDVLPPATIVDHVAGRPIPAVHADVKALFPDGLVPALPPTTSSPAVTPVTGTCLIAVTELLDDLTDALTINTDPSRQDLVPCVLQGLLGLPDVSTTPLADRSGCTKRLFRGRLVSDD